LQREDKWIVPGIAGQKRLQSIGKSTKSNLLSLFQQGFLNTKPARVLLLDDF